VADRRVGVTPTQASALAAVAAELSRGDKRVIAKMKAALADPPRTTEEVGFYVSGDENAFENCFRKLASLLVGKPYAMSAEDKYIHELFEHWTGRGRLKALPEAFHSMLPGSGAEPAAARARLRKGFVTGVQAVEQAFEDLGAPLLSVDTGGGDTMLMVLATPETAARWRDVKLGETHDGIDLAVRSPMWDVLWAYLEYSSGVDLGRPPKLPARPLRKLARARP
jgi:hypothetical protein